jgi:(p)ppGpp synthase/HD superfamily hydrolase
MTSRAVASTGASDDAGLAGTASAGQASGLTRSARTFAMRCHSRQRRETDGARFIEHPLEVAALLRDAGCSEVVVAAGLLHDVVEDSAVSVAELRARFGADVAELVRAVTDDGSIENYRRRKQLLREQVGRAGGEAALVFAADKISKVRELGEQTRRAGAARRPGRLHHHRQMRMEHYRESLGMLQRVAPQHPLVQRLEQDLGGCASTGI